MSVRGLERFRAYFRPHVDDYMLIGGTACAVLFDHLGVGFRRASKDRYRPIV